MTTIDFYTRCADPLDVAARLAAKAWAQCGSVRVVTPDAETTAALDSLLWRAPPTGFLPHCRLASPLAAETPIIVDHVLEHDGPVAVLVNLGADPPPFFARFERLAEVIGLEESAAAAGRVRWRFYKERGYELRSHDLSARS
jgi:DNA polymerase III subunit chi